MTDRATSKTRKAAGDCRLCGGDLQFKFQLPVLYKYPVDYLVCARCGSLQTEPPYWLAEAYSNAPAGDDAEREESNLNSLDVGAVQRNLTSLSAVLILSKLLGRRNVVDLGGGDGLLCRLLRDYGLNAYVSDPHASPVYAQGFDRPDFPRPDIVTAFEVFEHFAEPRRELDILFAQEPAAVLTTTLSYNGESSDWWYLIPETGHHVFFYTDAAFRLIGERYGYEVIRTGAYILYVRNGLLTKMKRRLVYRGLRDRAVELHRAYVALCAFPGVDRDFDALRAKAKR